MHKQNTQLTLTSYSLLSIMQHKNAANHPIFALRKLEWEPRSSKAAKLKNRRIVKVIVSNNMIVVATNTSSLIKFKINDLNKEPEEIEILNKSDDLIENLFMDHGGFHIVICFKGGENFYLCNSKPSKARKISKLAGNIECIAFDRSSISDTTTKFLAGTSNGFIYELAIDNTGKERSCQIVFQLNEPLAISSLFFEHIPCFDTDMPPRQQNIIGSYEHCLFAMFSTSHPTRLYHFFGGQTFQQLFSDNSNTACTELPGEISNAELHCYSQNGSTKAEKFALMTGAGIYNGRIIDNNRFLNEAYMLPYISTTNESAIDTIAIGVTDFHFLILKGDRYQALSSLSGELIQEDVFRNSDGAPLGIARDPLRNANFIYTNSCLFQVVSTEEDRDVWSTYLSKALSTGDDYLFESALAHSKLKEQKHLVMKSRAEACISQNNWEKAAEYFAQCGLSVDEAILKLLSISDPTITEKEKHSSKMLSSELLWLTALEKLDSIKMHLIELLKALPLSAKSQRSMICIWICEIYLHQLSVMDNSVKVEEEIKTFMRSHRNSLDFNTVIHLLLSRNNRQLLLFFSRIVGDYHGVTNILITERRYIEALEVIKSAPFEKICTFVYNLLPVLIEYVPLELTVVLLSKPQFSLSSLMPTFVRYISIFDRSLHKSCDDNYVILYIEELLTKVGVHIKENNQLNEEWIASPIDMNAWSIWMEPVAVNLIVWILAKYDKDEKSLVSFILYFCILRSNGFALDLVNIDPEFILRQCRHFSRRKSTVFALLLVNNPLQAVREALTIDLELAKMIAKKYACGEEVKTLWLEIARFMVGHFVDTKKAIALIAESCGVLKIEDLLPILSDFTDIDFLKDEICKSLSFCSSKIDSIKTDMTQLTESVDSTLKELDEMKNRVLTVPSTEQRCGVCLGYLFDRQFYLFPCSHGFHGCCLISESNKFLSSSQLAVVRDLESKIKMLGAKGKDLDNIRVKQQLETLQSELDGYIAADCLLCGAATVESLNISLVEQLSEPSSIIEVWKI